MKLKTWFLAILLGPFDGNVFAEEVQTYMDRKKKELSYYVFRGTSRKGAGFSEFNQDSLECKKIIEITKFFPQAFQWEVKFRPLNSSSAKTGTFLEAIEGGYFERGCKGRILYLKIQDEREKAAHRSKENDNCLLTLTEKKLERMDTLIAGITAMITDDSLRKRALLLSCKSKGENALVDESQRGVKELIALESMFQGIIKGNKSMSAEK